MDSAQDTHTLTVGSGAEARPIAVRQRPGGTPGLFWLGGFRSVMTGSKATELDSFGAEHGLAVTRFDYSGHGESGGRFEDGTISRWLEEAQAVFATTAGPQVVVGSSMGGWLALLLARAEQRSGNSRVKALVLIAPAVDLTETLMLPGLTPEKQAVLLDRGAVERPSAYGEAPYPLTRALIEDGRKHSLFGAPIEPGCPVAILQGGRDAEVPQAHAERLLTHLVSDPATLTVIPGGDHRLSRPEDLLRLRTVLRRTVEELQLPS